MVQTTFGYRTESNASTGTVLEISNTSSDITRIPREELVKGVRTSTDRKEEVVEIVQTSTDLDELRLVFHSFPSVRKFLLDILSARSDRDDLLCSLPHSLGDVNKLDVPKQPETRYMLIANRLDEEMHMALIEMGYTVLVEGTFAYSPDAVDKLIDIAMNRRLALLHGYLLDSQCVVTYRLVEQELRHRNPLAHWVVKHSLYGHDTPARKVLEFMFEPIKDIFAREGLRLIPMLQLLGVTIATRRYDGNGNSGAIFYRPSPFIEQIFLERPEEVAHRMTTDDYTCFQELCSEDLEYESPILRCLSKRWSRLSHHVKTCSITVPEYVGHISQVAQFLFTSGNDYSGTALLQGLKSAERKPDGLETLWEVINADDNYAAYRKRSIEVGAKLPFLFPLIWRLRQQQEAAKKKTAKDLRLQQAAEKQAGKDLTWWPYIYRFLLGRRRFSYKGQQALDVEKADCYLRN